MLKRNNIITLKEFKQGFNKGKKRPPPNNPIYCISCSMPHSEIVAKCTYCKSGNVHRFDSGLEGQRFIDLFKDKNIKHITPQYAFKKGLPEAIYEHGRGQPIFKGYKKEVGEKKEYKVDFIYYDNTCFCGWVAEEVKPNPNKKLRIVDRVALDKSKANLVDAYDQHKCWGLFCLTYFENGAFVRKFVNRTKVGAVRYLDYKDLIK